MRASDILRQAKTGTHTGCRRCPWNPKRTAGVAFGTSCTVHGADWEQGESVVTVQVVRDPAGTTPQQTGTLCFVCNAENPTDRTAQNALALWSAAVALRVDDFRPAYVERHYWTNAMMHGLVDADKGAAADARRACTHVLRDQLECLRPAVVIANGEDAAQSLLELGIIRRGWGELRGAFDTGAYREIGRLPSGHKVTSFVTYHTSAGAVNRTIANLYTQAIEERLLRKISRLPERAETDAFLDAASPDSVAGRGLRVLLLHWLDIGEAVRTAHAGLTRG